MHLRSSTHSHQLHTRGIDSTSDGETVTSYFRTTRANPTGHFRFTKIPAGRYYILSLIEEGPGLTKKNNKQA
jgi:hypothetical protein